MAVAMRSLRPLGPCRLEGVPAEGLRPASPPPLAFPTTVEDRAIKAKPPSRGQAQPRAPLSSPDHPPSLLGLFRIRGRRRRGGGGMVLRDVERPETSSLTASIRDEALFDCTTLGRDPLRGPQDPQGPQGTLRASALSVTNWRDHLDTVQGSAFTPPPRGHTHLLEPFLGSVPPRAAGRGALLRSRIVPHAPVLVLPLTGAEVRVVPAAAPAFLHRF